QTSVTIVVAPNQLASIATGWTSACSPVTIGSSNGWDTNFDILQVSSAVMSGTSTPTAMPTPTRTLTVTPTITPSPTQTPSPTPSSSATTVTFDDLASPNRPLIGQYPAGVVHWGNG